MTCELCVKSLILALQNRGGYRCHAVIDNPSDRIYHALSWLFAAASAFVCTVYRFNSRLCRVFAPLHLTPYTLLPTCHLSPSEPHRNLIGSWSEPHRNLTEGLPRDPKGIYRGYIRDLTLYSEQRAFGAYNPNNAAMLHVTHQRCIQRE